MRNAAIFAAMLLGLPVQAYACPPYPLGAAPLPALTGAENPADPAAAKAAKADMERMHAAMMTGYTGRPDEDFVRMMIPHHQGAIDMAHTLLTYSADSQLRRLAAAIRYTQELEIAYMRNWLERRGALENGARKEPSLAYERELEVVMHKMHHAMMAPASGNAEADFVTGMIPHHQGAIDMAGVQLRYGILPEMQKLAQDIIQAQQTEIALMQCWQRERGFPVTPAVNYP